MERLRLGSELGWPDVEAMVDRLVAQFELGERAVPASPQEAGELAVLFQDLAIGTTPLQRLGLVVRCQSVLDLGLDDAVGQRLVRAQVRLLEPLVARSGAADSRDSVLERGLELYESIEAAVTDPLTGEAPDFLRRSRLRIQRLRVGSPMPRFVARDTAGNELRSAQLEPGDQVQHPVTAPGSGRGRRSGVAPGGDHRLCAVHGLPVSRSAVSRPSSSARSMYEYVQAP